MVSLRVVIVGGGDTCKVEADLVLRPLQQKLKINGRQYGGLGRKEKLWWQIGGDPLEVGHLTVDLIDG